ncbi:hypothetical protein PSTT_09393 [Puccinia striiformis]|uniref:Micro-fibrillar-associated protein 1 C-terminal domain-containing protein n=1 Tax=Puccinia striiformis TaxID=27350 RepID=A0A2S4V8M7_9BASI|nr:hypothetical protein PSTT_09393 [Puccinia striiformis]
MKSSPSIINYSGEWKTKEMASSTRAPAKPAKIHRRGKQSTRTTKPSSSCSGSSSSEEGEQEQKKNQINYCTNQQHTNYLNQSKTKTTNTSHDPEDNSSSDSGDKQVDQVFPNVDDTNGLDPEAEFKSWKLRELKRLRRDGEVLIKLCAKEKEEIEARRLIPESERLKEDILYADQTRKSKLKGTQDSDIQTKHDYTAPTKGRFTKMELLPQAMQVRDFGKMSKTKWTHLSKESFCSSSRAFYLSF